MTDPELDRQHRETISRFFAAIQAGDYAVLQEVLTPDAITRWPQSGGAHDQCDELHSRV